MTSNRRATFGTSRADRYTDPAQDEGYDDELDEDEIAQGLKVVTLGKAGLKPGNEDRRKPDGRIFWEADDRHPGGEALVVKGRRVKVYPTMKVQRALGDGLLMETAKEPTPPPVQVADVLDRQRQAEAALAAQQQARLDEAGDETATGAAATRAQADEAAAQPQPQRKPGQR